MKIERVNCIRDGNLYAGKIKLTQSTENPHTNFHK